MWNLIRWCFHQANVWKTNVLISIDYHFSDVNILRILRNRNKDDVTENETFSLEFVSVLGIKAPTQCRERERPSLVNDNSFSHVQLLFCRFSRSHVCLINLSPPPQYSYIYRGILVHLFNEKKRKTLWFIYEIMK